MAEKVNNASASKASGNADSKNSSTAVAKKNKKPNIFVRFWNKCKEVFSELKKVTWPTFGNAVKQTGVVLVVVILFLIVITAFDFGLLQLFKLLTGME